MPNRREKKVTPRAEAKSPTSSSELSDKVLQGVIPPTNFLLEFPVLCAEENAGTIPEVVVMNESSASNTQSRSQSQPQLQPVREKPEISTSSLKITKSSSVPVAEWVPVVRVGYDFPDRQENPRQVIFRGFKFDFGMARALGRCFPVYNTLTILKLEDCYIESECLTVLSKFLEESKSVKDLNLDANPIKEQNYYCLLKLDTRLQYLSLRLCHIDDDGVLLLSQELGFKEPVEQQSLLSLNLTNNHITSVGAQHLANAMRTNRTLGALSLAGNNIFDEGTAALADVLQRFPLNHEEVVMRRHRNITRLIHRNSLIGQKIQEAKTSPGTGGKNGPTRGISPGKKTREGRSGGKSDKKRVPTPFELSEGERHRMEFVVDQELERDPHPYMLEVMLEGGEAWCAGNMRLAHLNLGYNRVGIMGVTALLQAAQYQDTAVVPPNKGLVYLVLQGNPISEKCFELQELMEVMANRTRVSKMGSIQAFRRGSGLTLDSGKQASKDSRAVESSRLLSKDNRKSIHK